MYKNTFLKTRKTEFSKNEQRRVFNENVQNRPFLDQKSTMFRSIYGENGIEVWFPIKTCTLMFWWGTDIENRSILTIFRKVRVAFIKLKSSVEKLLSF